MKVRTAYLKFLPALLLIGGLMACNSGESPDSDVDAMRRQVVELGKEYLGAPYKAAGKKPSTGFDCSGFTGYVYKQFGIHLSASSKGQAADGVEIKPSETLPGDLLIFAHKGRINHVGMVVEAADDGIHIIHSTSRGVVIDNVTASDYWNPRILCGRRVLGLGS